MRRVAAVMNLIRFMSSSMDCGDSARRMRLPSRRLRSRVRASLLAAACWLLAVVAAGAQSTTTAAPLTLAEAMDRALATNPTVAAARLQRPIDVAGVAVAGERPNPEVNYEAAKETPRQAIGATLPIELGGKRQRRIDVANATLAVGDATLARTIVEVRNDVRRAYFEAVAAARRAQIDEDIRALAQRARDAANARVVAGDVPRSDLTLSDLALATTENDLAGARAEATATLAELNALLGQPAGTAWRLTDTLSSGAIISDKAALDLAVQSNTELQLANRQIAEQEAKVNLAKALTVPDVSAGGAFTADAEPEFRYGWRVSAGVTVPVFTRHGAGVTVEQSTLARLRQD